MKAKLPKCKWAADQIVFLGHVIDGEGLHKSKTYFGRVRGYEPENIKTVKELHTFLGITLWQRKFMRRAAEIAELLTPLIGNPRKTEID